MAATNVQAFSGDIDIAGAITSNVEFGGSKFTHPDSHTTVFTGKSTGTDNEIGVFNVGSLDANNTFIDVRVVGTSGLAGNQMHYRVYIRPDSATNAFINTFERDNGGVLPVVYRTNAGNITSGVVRIGYEGSKDQYVKWYVEVSKRYADDGEFQVTNTGSAVDGTSLVQVTPIPATRLNSNLAVNADTLFVDSTNSKVGIGTTTPYTNLHIKRSDAPSGTITADDYYLLLGQNENGVGKEWRIGFGYNVDTTNVPPAYIGYHEEYNSSSTYGDLVFGARTNATGSTQATEHMRITHDGNVGIGTDNPNQLLTIKGGNMHIINESETIEPRAIAFYEEDGETQIGFLGPGSSSDNNMYLWGRTGHDTLIGAGNSERIRVKSNGLVGINYNNPQYTLDVQGDTRLQTCVIHSFGSGANRFTRFTNPEDDDQVYFQFRNQQSILNRTISAYVQAYIQDSSDDRLKVNEKHVTDGLDVIKRLKPQKYDKCYDLPENLNSNAETWIDRHEVGFMAQDIYYQVPELKHIVTPGDGANPAEHITIGDDPQQDPDYSSWGNVAASIRYTEIIPYNTAAIQDLSKLRDSDLDRITVLESKVSNLLVRVQTLESGVP